MFIVIFSSLRFLISCLFLIIFLAFVYINAFFNRDIAFLILDCRSRDSGGGARARVGRSHLEELSGLLCVCVE